MKKILEMIENVDPEDTNALDEIDARVWCWIRDLSFLENRANTYDGYGNRVWWDNNNPRMYAHSIPKYTRSRDALKAVRPQGCSFYISEDGGKNYFACFLSFYDEEFELEQFRSKNLPTEELAELHAIIQAIAWEREHAR